MGVEEPTGPCQFHLTSVCRTGDAVLDAEALKNKANDIRQDVISVSVKNGAGHIAPSLSCVDIIVALHYGVMEYRPDEPDWAQRDRLILSKAHGCYGLYAVLADKGLIPRDVWHDFYRQPGPLAGCAERRVEWGIEAGCGSLGHGLPLAVGLAYGAKLQQRDYHIFCVVGDGELQEGTNWEAIQFALKHQTDNLTIIIDSNGMQAMDRIVDVLDRSCDDLVPRLEGFGLKAHRCPGHDAAQIAKLAGRFRTVRGGCPNLMIAETIKGYGVACMENVAKFHFRVPTPEELQVSVSNG